MAPSVDRSSSSETEDYSDEDSHSSEEESDASTSDISDSASENEEESADEYKFGGFHPVKIGDVFHDRYTVVEKLGWGTFSTVWMARDGKTGAHVALKIQKSASRYAEAAWDEIELLQAVNRKIVNHMQVPGSAEPPVLRIVDYFVHYGPNGKHVCIVCEMLGATLLTAIKKYDYRGIPVPIVRVLAKQILKALAFLHDECQIIHTDLKPENVLLITDKSRVETGKRLGININAQEVSAESSIKREKSPLSGETNERGAGISTSDAGEVKDVGQSVEYIQSLLASTHLASDERKKLKKKLKKKVQKLRQRGELQASEDLHCKKNDVSGEVDVGTSVKRQAVPNSHGIARADEEGAQKSLISVVESPHNKKVPLTDKTSADLKELFESNFINSDPVGKTDGDSIARGAGHVVPEDALFFNTVLKEENIHQALSHEKLSDELRLEVRFSAPSDTLLRIFGPPSMSNGSTSACWWVSREESTGRKQVCKEDVWFTLSTCDEADSKCAQRVAALMGTAAGALHSFGVEGHSTELREGGPNWSDEIQKAIAEDAAGTVHSVRLCVRSEDAKTVLGQMERACPGLTFMAIPSGLMVRCWEGSKREMNDQDGQLSQSSAKLEGIFAPRTCSVLKKMQQAWCTRSLDERMKLGLGTFAEASDDDEMEGRKSIRKDHGAKVKAEVSQPIFDTSRPIRCKLVDLGNACWTYKHYAEGIQTRQYRAPEVILGQSYDASADIWSLGCLLFELVTGDYLFSPKSSEEYSRDEDHLAQMVELMGHIPKKMALNGKFARDFFNRKGELKHIKELEFWSLESVLTEKYRFKVDEAKAFSAFLMPMLAFNPQRRASAKLLLEHPFVRDVDVNKPPNMQWAPSVSMEAPKSQTEKRPKMNRRKKKRH